MVLKEVELKWSNFLKAVFHGPFLNALPHISNFIFLQFRLNFKVFSLQSLSFFFCFIKTRAEKKKV